AYVRGRSLYFHEGRFVGATAGSIFEINPATLDMTVLATAADNLAIDRNGNYYYRRGSELFRWSGQEVGGGARAASREAPSPSRFTSGIERSVPPSMVTGVSTPTAVADRSDVAPGSVVVVRDEEW